MRFARFSSGVLIVSALAFAVAGCGQTSSTPAGSEKRPIAQIPRKVHDHGGWWCDEHGIPEHECSMCSDEFAKECKAKGDWCALHDDRAKSQCFKCDPKLKEKYAAKYRAKYGEEPPPIGEEEKKDKKD